MGIYHGVPCIHEVCALLKGKYNILYLNFNPRWAKSFLPDQPLESNLLPTTPGDDQEHELIREIEKIENPTKNSDRLKQKLSKKAKAPRSTETIITGDGVKKSRFTLSNTSKKKLR